MSINNPIISVKNLHKSFKLPHEQHSGIKQRVVNIFKGIDGYDTQHVLKDISFDIARGEFFGIVGQNGSGKSTLLKLLAGIYAPDKGSIDINGSLTPFIELGVGFNHELTGRENIYMNGALLGMSRKEVDVIYDEIVSFAELEKFMDQKLKNYSSGMQVRLAFSIAIRSKSEILLFDEVLAVGDASFQQKCYETFSNMKDSGRTIILVTHDMSAVQRFCEKAILIDEGKITLIGKPSLIADRYLEQNYEEKSTEKSSVMETKAYEIKDAVVVSDGIAKKSYDLYEDISVSCTIENYNSTPEPLHIGFQIFNNDGAYIFGTNSLNAGIKPVVGKSTKMKIKLSQNLGPGTYYITLAVMNNKATKVLKYQPKMASFNIKQGTKLQGLVLLGNEWSKDV